MDAEQDRFWSVMEATAGKGTVETPRPAWARDPFLYGTVGGELAPPLGYEIVEDPGIAPPSDTFMRDGIESGIAEPEDFSAPKPGAIRAGDGYILKAGRVTKRSDFWSGSAAHVPLGKHEAAPTEKGGVAWPHGPAKWWRDRE
jgi:hypothetical protein